MRIVEGNEPNPENKTYHANLKHTITKFSKYALNLISYVWNFLEQRFQSIYIKNNFTELCVFTTFKLIPLMVLDGIDKFNLFATEQLIIMSTEVNQQCGVNNCRELRMRVSYECSDTNTNTPVMT